MRFVIFTITLDKVNIERSLKDFLDSCGRGESFDIILNEIVTCLNNYDVIIKTFRRMKVGKF